MSFNESSAMPLFRSLTLKAGVKTPQPTAAIKDLINEPLFWRGYTSDEEAASPTSTDDGMSSHSADNKSDYEASFVEPPVPEQLAITCNQVQQRCNRAQAVMLMPAGKAKVVSMPKLVDGPASRIVKPVASTLIRPPVSRLNNGEASSSGSISSTSSPRSSSEKSLASTAPSSVCEPSQRRLALKTKPSKPLLPTAARESQPVRQTTGSDMSPKLHGTRSSPLELPIASPGEPSSPTIRKLRKFSSSFSLGRLHNSFKRSASSGSGTGDQPEIVEEPHLITTSPIPTAIQVPLRSSSRVRPRMIPRGASERAAPLVLPPCPDQYDEGVDRTATRWPQRKDSAFVLPTTEQRPKTPKLHKRHRSMSGRAMLAQA